jgi:hypothetical protein
MALTEQHTTSIDRRSRPHSAPWIPAREAERAEGERAAIASLRAQVAKLERELSGIVASGFPHIPGIDSSPAHPHERERVSTPHLLTLGELEQLRDSLAERVHEARRRTATRAERERRSRALLERMKLEPGRYKFVRLRAADVGESGCGVWQVRPRLGIIGMLAGWWELKLSSGCP